MYVTEKIEETVIVVIKGKPVEAQRFITNREGVTYQFDRPAVQVRHSFCLDQMREDEVILSPGLIYRLVKEN